VFGRGERNSARRNRSANEGEYPLRVLGQIQPREAQDLPAKQRNLVLPLAIVLEVFLAFYERPSRPSR
jgi:hypothetical protein